MISDIFKQRVKDEVECVEDYLDFVDNVKMSSAPLEDREDALKYLETCYPEYSGKVATNASVMKDIEAGQADTDDINGY